MLASVEFDTATEPRKEWEPYGEITTDTLVQNYIYPVATLSAVLHNSSMQQACGKHKLEMSFCLRASIITPSTLPAINSHYNILYHPTQVQKHIFSRSCKSTHCVDTPSGHTCSHLSLSNYQALPTTNIDPTRKKRPLQDFFFFSAL